MMDDVRLVYDVVTWRAEFTAAIPELRSRRNAIIVVE